MRAPLTILCAAKLHANQLERHLEPFERLACVERVLVVRSEPIGDRLSKVKNVDFGNAGTLRNAGRMFRGIDAALSSEKVDWVLAFNPVPWGAIAWAASVRHRVPVCLSLIGQDYRRLLRPIAAPLWLALRGARVVTVTGERMRTGLIERGLPAEKIRVLPHAVDTDRFSPATEPAELDVVCVGQLIARKRVDVLIAAVGKLRDRGVLVRTGILGKGPLQADLERQIRELRLADRIELLGYRDDVESVLRKARIFALVSEWEGVPFAMIEAVCAGLVPVVTDVGTIGDFIKDEKNGRLLRVGDVDSLADALERLLAQRDYYDRLRTEALKLRTTMSLDAGAEFWRSVLQGSDA